MKEFLPTSLPERWQKRPLEDVVLRMSNGITKRQTKDGNGLPVSRIESISHGVVDMTRVGYLSGLSSSEVENYRLKAGDILFSHINSDLHLGKTAVFSLDSDTLLHGMNLLLIRVDSKKALPAFLHWLFNFYRVGGLFMSIAQHAVNQSSINQAKLKQLPVILPPLPEQRRIVAEIEKQFTRLEAGVAALRRVRANLKRYRAAVLKAACEGRLVPTEAELNKSGSGVPPLGLGKKRQDTASTFETGEALLARILTERRKNWQGRGQYKEPAAPDTKKLPPLPNGWTWATVEQLSTRVQYGSSAKTNEDSDGVPVLRMGNIQEGKLDFDKLKYLLKVHDEFPELLLARGDLLFNRTNSAELVGKTAVFKDTPNPCSFASYLIRVRFGGGCVSDFVSYYINSVFGRSWIADVVSQQVGQANVNGTKLQALAMPLSPLAEQTRIVAEVARRLSVVEELEAVVSANLQRATRLRQSILQKAFTGKLTKQ